MSKEPDLTRIAASCEKRFNKGEAAGWKHGDYSTLSREIYKETKITISPNTLKRIFGKIAVGADYEPQQATIDALKRYGGFREKPNGEDNRPGNDPPPRHERMPPHRNRTALIALAIVLIMVVPGLYGWFLWHKNNAFTGEISIRNIRGLLPATAIIDLRVPDIRDSVFVNFGDKSPLIPVKSNRKTITHDYLFPGVFIVKLQTREHPLATTRVAVSSNGWVALAYQRQMDLPNHYYQFPAVKTGRDSVFQISARRLSGLGLDTAGLYYTRLCNYTSTRSAADRFIFEAKFKNLVNGEGIYCKGTQFEVTGMNGRIRFKLANPGCTARILNVVGEHVFRGSQSDLSRFTLKPGDWNNIRIVNQDKRVALFVNGRTIFEGAYQQPLGQLKGVFIEFEGNGLISRCELKTPDGKSYISF
jgi:hypothetical protein